MPRVVHLVDNLSRQDGGIFESVLGFANEQSKDTRWTVQIAAIEDDDTAADQSRLANRVSALLLPAGNADFIGKKLARLVENAAPDLIHVHGIWGSGARAGYQLGRRDSKLGVIVSPHGMLDPWALRNSRWKKQLGWHAWAKPLLARTDVIHALATPEREAIETVAKKNSTLAVIANGVAVPTQLARPEGAPRLLFLGRIHPKKGLPALLEAWASLEGRLNGWRLDIAGWSDGGHEDELKAQCKQLGLGGSVSFIGPVFGKDKDALLRSASAFVLPSQSEGLPMAVLEAWSYGIPVLMTRECNLAEGFAAGAALEHRPTQESLIEAINQLISMPRELRISMGENGRSLVERQFSWKMVTRRMTEVYDATLDRHIR